MSDSKTLRFRPTVIAALLAGGLQAATLGEAQVSSWLGQALAARIRINAGTEESLRRDCFTAALHEGDSDGTLRRSAVDFMPDKNGGWLHIISESAMNEPILALSIKLHCNGGAELKREYTLFLDPAVQPPRADRAPLASTPQPAVRPPLTVAPATVVPPATEPRQPAHAASGDEAIAPRPPIASDYSSAQGESISAIAHQRYPGKPDSAKLYAAQLMRLNSGIGSDTDAILPTGTHLKMPPALALPAHPLGEVKSGWTVQPGESFFAIVRKIYPDQPARKKALVALLRKLNPDLPRDGEKPLPAGMKLQMPARLDGKPEGPAGEPPTKPAPVPAATASKLAEPAAPPASGGRLIVSSGAPAAPAKDESGQLQQRETVLTDQLSEQTARLNEAQYRIDKLEKHLTWLTEELAKREQAEKVARAQKAAQPAAVAAPTPWLGYGIAGGIGAIVALLLALLLRRSGRRQSESSQQAERLAQSLQSDGESMLWQDLHAPPAPAPMPSLAEVVADRPQASPSAADMDVFYLNNVASEAALLAAHGQYDHAIKLLKDEIEARPTQIVNWMQLLELYHGHRDAAAFIDLAQRFRNHFASQALWSKVVRMGVELAPHEPLFRPGSRPISVPANVRPDTDDELTAVLDSLAPTEPASPSVTPQARSEAPEASQRSAAEPAPAPGVQPHIEFDLHDDRAPAPAPAALEPLMFELDLPSEKHAPTPATQHLIDLPGEAANSPIMEFTPAPSEARAAKPIVEGSLAHAEALIASGERERGAELLEQLMLTGSLDERITAAELLVKLTSPDDDSNLNHY